MVLITLAGCWCYAFRHYNIGHDSFHAISHCRHLMMSILMPHYARFSFSQPHWCHYCRFARECFHWIFQGSLIAFITLSSIILPLAISILDCHWWFRHIDAVTILSAVISRGQIFSLNSRFIRCWPLIQASVFRYDIIAILFQPIRLDVYRYHCHTLLHYYWYRQYYGRHINIADIYVTPLP